jgi:hypothetical protein
MTTNLPNGTFVGFQITGTVNNSDIQIQGGCADESNDLNYFWDQSIPVEGAGVIEGGIGGIYSNGFTVGSLASNMAVLNQGDITACEDQVTEGPETLIITLIGYQIPGGEYMYINEAIQATITINDTSVEVEEISDKLLTVKNDEQEDTPNN